MIVNTINKYQRSIHYFSGLIIAVFTLFHFANHLFSLKSPEAHIGVMEVMRKVYRHPAVETILMLAVVVQIYTGLKLLKGRKAIFAVPFEKIRYYSGIYLAIFLIIHPVAIWTGRLILKLDTNFYYGATGFNDKPYPIFFFPYYLLAIVSFFSHLAVVHYNRMQKFISRKAATTHSWLIIMLGFVIWILIVYGFTGGFRGIQLPQEYHYLPSIVKTIIL